MSYPPIFELANADAGVRTLLKSGAGPLRFWLFARAPQKGQPGYGLPYAVWQQVGGQPENYVAGRPDADNTSLQVDAYGETAEAVRAVSEALRHALELDAYVTGVPRESKDPDTSLFRSSFDVDFITTRI